MDTEQELYRRDDQGLMTDEESSEVAQATVHAELRVGLHDLEDPGGIWRRLVVSHGNAAQIESKRCSIDVGSSRGVHAFLHCGVSVGVRMQVSGGKVTSDSWNTKIDVESVLRIR